MPSHDRDELDEIAETMFQHVADDAEVDIRVAMHEDVSKADHLAQGRRQRRRNPAVAFEQSNSSRLVRGSPMRSSDTICEATSSAA